MSPSNRGRPGETVRCECSRSLVVPTMREVQRGLRPAPLSDMTPAAMNPAWGNSQRFLAAGLVLFLLAAIAAVLLYNQFPTHFAGLPTPEAERQRVSRMSPEGARRYFHQSVVPGIRLYERPETQSRRSMVYLGMATFAGLGAVGLILVGIGVSGIIRRQ